MMLTPEEQRAYNKKYYQEHKDEILEQRRNKKEREAYNAKMRDYLKEYRKKNGEKLNAQARERHAANREEYNARHREYQRKYRARRKEQKLLENPDYEFKVGRKATLTPEERKEHAREAVRRHYAEHKEKYKERYQRRKLEMQDTKLQSEPVVKVERPTLSPEEKLEQRRAAQRKYYEEHKQAYKDKYQQENLEPVSAPKEKAVPLTSEEKREHQKAANKRCYEKSKEKYKKRYLEKKELINSRQSVGRERNKYLQNLEVSIVERMTKEARRKQMEEAAARIAERDLARKEVERQQAVFAALEQKRRREVKEKYENMGTVSSDGYCISAAPNVESYTYYLTMRDEIDKTIELSESGTSYYDDRGEEKSYAYYLTIREKVELVGSEEPAIE